MKRAYDILRGVDLLSARSDVEAGSIHAAGQGVKGIWLLLAAAADSPNSKGVVGQDTVQSDRGAPQYTQYKLFRCGDSRFCAALGPGGSPQAYGRPSGVVDGPDQLDGKGRIGGLKVPASLGARRSYRYERCAGCRVPPPIHEVATTETRRPRRSPPARRYKLPDGVPRRPDRLVRWNLRHYSAAWRQRAA